MTASPVSGPARTRVGTDSMRAAVFERPGVITLQERPVPTCGPTDAIVRVTMTTICGRTSTSCAASIRSRPAASSGTSLSA
jgi:hypothetical protein